jgi:hypothetical protein
MDFGYLPQSDLETGNLRTDDQLRDAIRTLQVSDLVFSFCFFVHGSRKYKLCTSSKIESFKDELFYSFNETFGF